LTKITKTTDIIVLNPLRLTTTIVIVPHR